MTSTQEFITLPSANGYTTGYPSSSYNDEPYYPYRQAGAPADFMNHIDPYAAYDNGTFTVKRGQSFAQFAAQKQSNFRPQNDMWMGPTGPANQPNFSPTGRFVNKNGPGFRPNTQAMMAPGVPKSNRSSFDTGRSSHFDVLRLQGHSYPPSPRPQTDARAIVTETLQTPYSGNLLTAVQIEKKDVRYGKGGSHDTRQRQDLLNAAGWTTTSEQEQAWNTARGPPSKTHSHMTDIEYNDYGWNRYNVGPGQVASSQNQSAGTTNSVIMNPTSNQTYQNPIAGPQPWQPNYPHMELIDPYKDYNEYGQADIDTLSDNYKQYYDQTGRQVTGIAFDPNKVEIDPILETLPRNHPVIMRAQHDYAARVAHKVYPQDIAAGIRRTVVADTKRFRDIPWSLANS